MPEVRSNTDNASESTNDNDKSLSWVEENSEDSGEEVDCAEYIEF